MSYAPTQKVAAGAVSGAIAAVGMGVFAIIEPEVYARVPPGFEGGVAVIIGSFFAYMKKEP